MPRPCHADHDPSPSTCAICKLALTDAAYAALWGEQIPSAPYLAGGHCRFQGGDTGERVLCPSCRGHVELKLIGCSVHGKCSPGKPVEGVAYCGRCKERQRLPGKVCHVMNHGLGDNVQMGVVLRHLRHYWPDDEQHVVTPRGKSTAFRQVAHKVHLSTDRKAPPGDWVRVFDHPWENPVKCYPDSASTKAAHFLREVLKVPVLPELSRYEIHVSEATRKRVEGWVADHVPTERFAVLHYEGASWKNHKDLTPEHVLPVVDALLAKRITPVVFDLDGRSPLTGRRRVFGLGRHDPLWAGIGTGDAETMAALMGLSALNVCIDSGPGKVAASVAHVPCLTVWRELHPVHFSDLDYGQVLHLVPDNHALFLRGEKDAGLGYFRQHYSYETYDPGELGRKLRMLALLLLEQKPDFLRRLVSRSNRWATMWPFLQSLPAEATVVETGCMRQHDDYGAGMSTLIFGVHLERTRGKLVSVDNNGRNVDLAERVTNGYPVSVHQSDSRDFLRDWVGFPIDGLYLDSADVGLHGYEECCLEEAQLAVPHLKPSAHVLIDDTSREAEGWKGKGRLAIPWLISQGFEVVASRFQVLLKRSAKGG